MTKLIKKIKETHRESILIIVSFIAIPSAFFGISLEYMLIIFTAIFIYSLVSLYRLAKKIK